MLEKKFNERQKEVDRGAIVALTNENKVLSCISQCKKQHGGPLTTVKEFQNLKKKFRNDEKNLNCSLNLEIRFVYVS